MLARRLLGITFMCACALPMVAQMGSSGDIKELKWGMNYQVYLYLTNDSSVVLNLQDMPRPSKDTAAREQFTFLPVNLDNRYVSFLRERNQGFSAGLTDTVKAETLWGSIHEGLGGGWIHFLNCVRYSLETGMLDPRAPLMKRPETKWKPDPPTESWKRTRKWKYYIPETQKLAHREYKATLAEGRLDLIQGIPADYLELFLSTNDARYRKLIQAKKVDELARINLVKLLLASKYMGKAQLSYIRTQVLKSAMQFPARTLPTMIFMDEYNAAVSMTLDETGYRIDKVFFKDEKELSPELRQQRMEQIGAEIASINTNNRKIYEKMLKNYFH